jgi:hypothetical protein
MSFFSRLRRRYGHAAGRDRKWQVSLQVKSPSRPELSHQLEYTMRASSREAAISDARKQAERDGNTVVSVVGAAKRPG